MSHHFLTLLFTPIAGKKFSITLEGGNDIEFFVLPSPGSDRTTVDHKGRAVESCHRYQASGHILIAARQRHVRVVPMRLHHRFHRVCDQVSRLQRIAHPLGPHGDAIANPNGVKAHADHPRILDPLLDLGGELIEMHIAGIAFVPDTCDTDLRFGHIGIREPRSVKHRLRSTLAFRLGNPTAISIQSLKVCHIISFSKHL